MRERPDRKPHSRCLPGTRTIAHSRRSENSGSSWQRNTYDHPVTSAPQPCGYLFVLPFSVPRDSSDPIRSSALLRIVPSRNPVRPLSMMVTASNVAGIALASVCAPTSDVASASRNAVRNRDRRCDLERPTFWPGLLALAPEVRQSPVPPSPVRRRPARPAPVADPLQQRCCRRGPIRYRLPAPAIFSVRPSTPASKPT
jgi:hypothetical protein